MRLEGAFATARFAIASYFAASFGVDSIRVLTSPLFGLEELRRSELIFAAGRLVGLDPDGLIRLAAWLGAFELAVAGLFVVYICERADVASAQADHETLEAALILVVMSSLIAAVLAFAGDDGETLRRCGMHGILVGLVAVLGHLERRPAAVDGIEASAPARPRWSDPSRDGWFAA